MNGNKTEILRILKSSGSKPVSGQEIGSKLGITRAMVWKYIKEIKKDGYEIQSSPKIGYTLKSSPDMLYPEQIKIGLETSLLGKEIVYYDEVESTNSIAKELAGKYPEGTIVIAETQKKGRGRMGSDWLSLPGGIWFSVILKPSIPLEYVAKMTLVAGLAVTKAMRDLGVDARIKWPNDVLINGKKVCGILTEVDAEVEQVEHVILGIGINANVRLNEFREDIKENSTSIEAELGEPIDRISFIKDLLFQLEQEYIKFKTQQFSNVVSEWISLSDTIGKKVTVTTPTKITEGKAVGITDRGALLILTDNNVKEEIIAGRCRYIK
ncbi:biotin--[acetyl-CoA-carboxylase] ligase [Methanolobus halotolerans]|uniref:Biotin--[acetyl-CoA-carboxylase] ligase n=1 Tax=Methanolobus halotolerans TaxID=2052935 RepID=A0A4E0PYK3_9EURY|nr:biotin--[acetyl-CoA-carboxylase] ligase [Methanolobus halotolerans]TGC11412.1 biotin--[acetyl-CoA-carboxylase] ligase [Methanolobus halotolerans]